MSFSIAMVDPVTSVGGMVNSAPRALMRSKSPLMSSVKNMIAGWFCWKDRLLIGFGGGVVVWLALDGVRPQMKDSRAAIALLDPKEPVEVPAPSELAFRHKVFVALLQKANPALDAPARGVDAEFERRLADDKWAGDPLYLMMAGLAAAREGVQAALGLSRADLALSTGRNELERIGRIGAARGIDEIGSIPAPLCAIWPSWRRSLRGSRSPKHANWPPGSATVLARRRRSTRPSRCSLMRFQPAAGARLRSFLMSSARGAPCWFGAEGGPASAGLDPEASIASTARVALGKVSATLIRAAQDFAAGYAEPISWLEGLAGAETQFVLLSSHFLGPI